MMKRFISLLLSILLVVTMAVPAFAESTGSMTVTLTRSEQEKTVFEKNETFTVTVSVACNNDAIKSGRVLADFPDTLELTNVVFSNGIKLDDDIKSKDANKNTKDAIFASDVAKKFEGEICIFTFKVLKGSASSSTVSFDVKYLDGTTVDESGTAVPVATATETLSVSTSCGENHAYGDEIPEVPAVCGKAGKEAHYVCADCGKIFTKSGEVYTEVEEKGLVIPALDHEWDTKNWTNDETGHWHACLNDGCEEKSNFSAHNNDNWSYDVNDHWKVCSVCGYVDEGSKENHREGYRAGETGHDKYCSVCNKVYDTTILPHTYNGKILITEENKNEIHEQYGTVGTTAEYVTDENGHAYKCDYCPHVEKTPHTYDNSVWENDETNHWHVCTDGCDYKVGNAAHTYDQEVVGEKYLKSAATCESNAVYYKSCECGAFIENDEYTFEATDTQKAHNYVHQSAQAATCEADGWFEYYKCTNGDYTCGKYFVKTGENTYELIGDGSDSALADWKNNAGKDPKTNHAGAQKTDEDPATCTETGLKAYWYCDACKNYFEDDNGIGTKIGDADAFNTWKTAGGVIAATGHTQTPAHTEKQDSTCTEAGYEEYWYCDQCETYFSDEVLSGVIGDATALGEWKTSGNGYIEPKGHNPSETPEVPATCVATGTKAYWYCDRCETYYSDSACSAAIGDVDALDSWLDGAGKLAVDPAAHDFDESTWITEGGNAKHWHPCKNEGCEAKGSETDHNYTVLVSKDADGHIYKCEQCDAQNAKQDHDHNGNGGELVNTDPSGHWYVCSCGYEPVDKADHVFDEDDCTMQGTCECGYVREAGEHVKKAGYSNVVLAATCEAKGKTQYQCDHCDEYFVLEDIPALGHSYEGATPDYDWADDYSTCTATVDCQREGCDHTETETANGSNVVYTKETDKTCKEKETGHYTATFTKGVFTIQQTATVEVGDFAAHTTNKTNAVAATCTVAGLEAYWKCSVCDKYFEDDNGSVGSEIADFGIWSAVGGDGYIAPTAHEGTNSHTDKLDSTCTVPGHEEYWYCSACRKYFSNSGLTNVIADIDVWASQGGAGYIAPKGHISPAAHTDAVAETCTTSGVKEYWYCSQCQTYFSDSGLTTVIGDASALETWKTTGNGFVPAKGHVSPAAHTNAVAATCTTSGVKEYWYCSQCQTYFSNSGLTNVIGDATDLGTWKTTGNGFVPAKGHVARPDHTNAVAATCTEYGVKEYWYCSQCQTYFSDSSCQNAIGDSAALAGWKEDPAGGRVDMIDHIYDRQVLDNDTLVYPATCTEKAVYYYSCECGEIGSATFEYGSALGHHGVAQSATAPKCEDAGNESYYRCTNGCDKYFEDESCTVEITNLETWKAKGGNGYVAPIGHKTELTSSTDATCDTDGSRTYTCTRTGCTYNYTETIEKHHTYNANGVCSCGAELDGQGKTNLEAVVNENTEIPSDENSNTDANVNTPVTDLINSAAGNDLPANVIEQIAGGTDFTVTFTVNTNPATPNVQVKIDEAVSEKIDVEEKNGKVSVSAPIEIDLSMLLGSTGYDIHNLSSPIEVSVPLPEEIQEAIAEATDGYTVEYFVIRIHTVEEGKEEVTILNAKVENGELIFDTDKLSTFVPMVVVTPNEEEDPEPERKKNEHKGGITITVGERTEETKPEPEENPNTGAPVFDYTAAVIAVAAAALAVSKKRK